MQQKFTRGRRRTAGIAVAVAMGSAVVPFANAEPARAAAVSCTPIAYTDCVRYTYTGGDQTFTVPAGITSLFANVYGAGGGNGPIEAGGGGGGWAVGTIAVTPGQVLTITVGEGGKADSAVGTYGGGGRGGNRVTPLESGGNDGSSGGGMSAIWLTSYGVGPVLIAGGGGGGAFESADNGGRGGGSSGTAGSGGAASGAAGTQVGGGAAGNSGCQDSSAGSAYQGGSGGDDVVAGAGGGGGYYGGGGGDCRTGAGVVLAGAGGGGSGFKQISGGLVSGGYLYAATNTKSAGDNTPRHTAGIGDAGANGEVFIEWVTPPTASPLTSTGPFGAPQSATATVPVSGSVRLLNAADSSVTAVAAPGQGNYSVNTGTGVITFFPDTGFTGTATPVRYRITVGELNATSTYTPTVGPKPATKPAPTALTSTGVGTAVQTVTATVPAGHTITLVGPGGTPSSTVTVASQGTYTVNTATAAITFTPVAGFQGTATAVGYRLTNEAGLTGDSTYTPTVTKTPPPTPTAKTTSALGPLVQTTAVDLPPGGSVGYVSGGTVVPSLTVPGQGTYGWSAADKVLTFTPVGGYIGTATTATYRVTDGYEQHGDSTYTATVTIPPPPDPPDRTTSGEGVTPQTATLPVPAKGTISLVDANGVPTTSLYFPNQGTYTLQLVAAAAAASADVSAAAGGSLPNPSPEPGSATVIFTPVLGFHGALPPVDYQVTDAYGQSATATYTPLVTIPAPPSPPSQSTTGPPDKTQTATLTVPTGGSITLLDAKGRPAIVVQIARQGTYVLQPGNGHISFVAEAGFSGQAKAVRYRVTDAYGQVAESTYSAFVGTRSAAAGQSGAGGPGSSGRRSLAVTGLALLDLIMVGAAMVPAGATLVVLGRPRRRRLRLA